MTTSKASISVTEVSNELRRIATKIDNSRNPSISLVAAELMRVLAAMDSFSKPPEIDDRRDKEMERRKEKETEDTLKKTKEELGKNMEKLVEEGFKNLEHNTR